MYTGTQMICHSCNYMYILIKERVNQRTNCWTSGQTQSVRYLYLILWSVFFSIFYFLKLCKHSVCFIGGQSGGAPLAPQWTRMMMTPSWILITENVTPSM